MSFGSPGLNAHESLMTQDTLLTWKMRRTFTRNDSLQSQMKRDADDVKKLNTQLTRLDVLRVNTAVREEDITADGREKGILPPT